jgi:hypothetical protein
MLGATLPDVASACAQAGANGIGQRPIADAARKRRRERLVIGSLPQ